MNPVTSFPRTNWLLSALAPAGVLATLLVWVAPASGALDIIPVFNAQASASPGFDPTGAGLISLFAEAESIYEDIIYDSHTLKINFWYEDLTEETLGIHSLVSQGGNPWRETACNIRIDVFETDRVTERPWFIDGSPDNHDEFHMVQTLYRDLDPNDQARQFNGDVPDVFEAAYSGAATDPASIGRIDMLTIILHEIGHGLGMSASNHATTAETGDLDYDVDPGFVGGAAMAVRCVSEDNVEHLRGADMLMRPRWFYDLRKLPSQADLFAMASGHDYGIVLPARQDYLGGWEFTDPDNWIGVGINHLAHAYVRRNGGPAPYAVTQTDYNMRNLSILEGSWVTTDDTMTIYETTTVDGADATAGDSRIRIQSNGLLNTTDLHVAFGGVVQLIGGTLDVEHDADVDLGGRIQGYGTVVVDNYLSNNGRIAPDGGQLYLTTNVPGTEAIWDLDGGGGGTVDAADGNVDVHGSHVGWFHGTMIIGQGRYVSMDRAWVLADDGLVQFNGAEGSPARLLGTGRKDIRGELEVNGDAVIDSPVLFIGPEDGGDLDVRIIDPSDRLTVTGPATFRGGRFYGDGTLVQASDFTVEIPTVITTHTFDWGNSDLGQRNDMIVEAGASIEVRSSLTGTPDNEYRGNIYLQNGTLEVNTAAPWTLPVMAPDSDLPQGMLILGAAKNKAPSTVAGQQLTVGGTVRAYEGLSVIDAPFVTTPTATIAVYAEAELELRRSTWFNGGTISGDGGIRQIGDARVVGSTQIATSYYDFDGDDATPSRTTIDPNVILEINSTSIENGGADSFDGVVHVNGGRLTVNLPFPRSWTLGESGAMNLTYAGGFPIVTGSPLVVSGNVTTVGRSSFHSAVRFRKSANVVATAWNDVLELRGHTDYEGGSYTGGGGIIQHADAFVNAPTRIDLGFFDMDGPPDANGDENTFIELHSDLALMVDRIDTGGNRFDGELEITDPAKLTVNTPMPWTMAGSLTVAGPAGTQATVAGAEVVLQADVHIEPKNLLRFHADVSGPGNFVGGGDYEILGNYNPGSSPAVITSGGNVFFANSARLILDIGGTDVVPVPQYDRLVVAGDVVLDGTVVFRFIDDFVPRQNDTFDVIVAVGAGASMLGDEDIVIENLAAGFQYDAGFKPVMGLNVFRLTALSDAVLASSIAGRHIFYNNSVFDLPADGRTDDDAVAPDKQALLPGETATSDNYTSYDKGINGIMVDVDGLTGTPTSDDFRFKVGNDNDPDGWDDAPAPTDVLVDLGEGVNQSDRITILFEDGAVMNQWLQVTVLATEETGLELADVFYFGNAVGESGNLGNEARVNAVDALLARNNPRSMVDPAPIDFPYDFNRDGRVNAADMLVARGHQTHMLDGLNLITAPAKATGGVLDTQVVPEPGMLAMLMAGVLGLLLRALARRRFNSAP